jgi:hypothetical protein
MSKKIVGVSLFVILLGIGLYYYIWLQAATLLKEEWVTAAERLNDQSKGTAHIHYDTIQTTGFPKPEIKILLKNLSLEFTQAQETSLTPVSLNFGDVHGIIRLNDPKLEFTFDKTFQVNYKEAAAQQPLSMKVIYQASPTLTITRSISDLIILKKLLYREKIDDFLSLKSVESLSFVSPASHNELSVDNQTFTTDKSQGMKINFSQKEVNQKSSIQFFWSISNYEVTNEYFDYLIKTNQVPQKEDFFRLIKDFNSKIGPISFKHDMAFLGDMHNLQKAWSEGALDINLFSIQSQLGGIDIALHAIPGDVSGYVQLTNYATFIPEIIAQYNAIVDSEYGQMMAVTTGTPPSQITSDYAESFLTLLKTYGKPIENDLRFDYAKLPTGDIGVNDKSGSQLFIDFMTLIETVKGKQQEAPVTPQADTNPSNVQNTPESESSTTVPPAIQESTAAGASTEPPHSTDLSTQQAPSKPIDDQEMLPLSEDDAMDFPDEEIAIEPEEKEISAEEAKIESDKKIEELEAAKQKTLQNIKALQEQP